MKRRGRPLRFLGATLGGWAALRTGMVWPTLDAARDLLRELAPPAAAAVAPADPARPLVPRTATAATAATPTPARHAGSPAAVAAAAAPPRDPRLIALAAASYLSFGRAMPIEEEGAIPPPLRPTPVRPPRRLTASAWAILRGGTDAALPGGQLGGAQAGARIAWAVDGRQRLALTARISAPLAGRGAEAAAGIELRPARILRIVAERRVALDGAGQATAVYAVGGTDPVAIAAGFRLEAYAQAGMVVRGSAEGFADGAARLTRAVSPAIDLGIGAWGGAQAGTERIDIGPTIGVALPVAGRRVRLSLDWRQRVGGRARPGSGPALSIGSDF